MVLWLRILVKMMQRILQVPDDRTGHEMVTGQMLGISE